MASTQTPTHTPSSQFMPPPSTQKSITYSNLPRGLRHLPARYKLSPLTLHLFSHLPRAPSPPTILELICRSPDIPPSLLRPDASTRSFLSAVNNVPSLPWRLKARPTLPWHKAYLIFQIFLMPSDVFPNVLTPAGRKMLLQDRKQIFKHLATLLRCTADILGIRSDYAGLSTCLYLLRSLSSSTFDASPTELLQIPSIGPKKVKALVTAGITICRRFASLDSSHIERLLKRQPPFGESMRRTMAQFPRLTISARQLGRKITSVGGEKRRSGAVMEVVLGMENAEAPRWAGKVLAIVVWCGMKETGDLTFFWRGSVGMVEKATMEDGDGEEDRENGRDTAERKIGIVLRFVVEDEKVGRTVEVKACCDEVVGSTVSCAVSLV